MIGTIILAGGDGTRLNWEGPKGTFIVAGKSLFDHQLDKCPDLTLCTILTSPSNTQATREFLKEKPVEYLIQNTLPLKDDQGNSVGEAPNGNGEVFYLFYDSGLFEKWKKRGVVAVTIVPIDNPLADPFDPKLIEKHLTEKNDVTLNVIELEKLGAVLEKENKISIIEYSEIHGNTGLFCFSMNFIEKLATLRPTLPLHSVKKRGLWKHESYIFDLLPFAEKSQKLIRKREECFAPIKSESDIESVIKLL